jgi:hypothetical protein
MEWKELFDGQAALNFLDQLGVFLEDAVVGNPILVGDKHFGLDFHFIYQRGF